MPQKRAGQQLTIMGRRSRTSLRKFKGKKRRGDSQLSRVIIERIPHDSTQAKPETLPRFRTSVVCLERPANSIRKSPILGRYGPWSNGGRQQKLTRVSKDSEVSPSSRQKVPGVVGCLPESQLRVPPRCPQTKYSPWRSGDSQCQTSHTPMLSHRWNPSGTTKSKCLIEAVVKTQLYAVHLSFALTHLQT